MRAHISKKTLIIAIFFFLFLLLAGNASSQVEPIYAGWTVGASWDDGSGTRYGTILRSADSGETWIRQGIGQIADVDMGAVFAVAPYTAWVVGKSDDGYATIYHTTDGGNIWERKGSSDPGSPDYVPDVNLSKVHAAGNDVWAVSMETILHTSDGGDTWTIHHPDDNEKPGLQGVYTLDGKTVWLTGGSRPLADPDQTYGVIYKTTNAGRTWTITDVDFDEVTDFDAILSISAVDVNTAWAVGGAGYILLKTADGGTTWTRIKEPNFPWGGILFDLNEVYAVNNSTVWVAGDNNIYWSHDGGESWDSGGNYGLTGCSPYGSMAFMGISAVSDQKAWGSFAGTFGCIAYTTDGGNNWTKVDQLNGVKLPELNFISFATRPINLDEMIISLSMDVEQLVDDGLLNQGQGNALIVKLEQAMGRMVSNRLKAAVNVLDAFSNQVEAFMRSGVLPPDVGQDLADQVNGIIELL